MHLKWTVMSAKWNLKSIMFWMLLASAVLLLEMLKFLSLRHEDTNRVLVYTGSSQKAEAVMGELSKDAYHGFDFEPVQNVEELKEAVYRSEALAGIEFTEAFDETVEKGELRQAVVLYSPPDSVANVILREMLFPCILQYSSPALLSSYMKEAGIPDEHTEDILKNNDAMTDTWKVGLFEVTQVPSDRQTGTPERSYVSVIVFLLMVSVFVMTFFEERKSCRPFLMAHKRRDRMLLVLESAAVRTAMFALLLTVFESLQK